MRSPSSDKRRNQSPACKLSRTSIVLMATVILASCTNPFVTSIARKPTGVGLDRIVLETMSDLNEFFRDEQAMELSENLTIDAAEISGANEFRWSVNGLDPAENDTPLVSVGDDVRSLTVNREHDDFELTYPVGTTFSITLRLNVDSQWYSGTRTLVVVGR